ncbi:DUF1223 domain-containing protein [Dyella psychrodurans]|nr:DUF1223 domain-containing protein [Dyella psychrodurans]
MTKHFVLSTLVGFALTICAFSNGYATEAKAQPLVVVELFHSQGCSSCPPAEANINAIAGQPNVLALSFAVTYWDDLGWKDTFGATAYTDRQQAYARYHESDTIYTPQVYVNGHTSLVGIDRAELDDAIHAASMHGPSVTWIAHEVTVGDDASVKAPCDVWLVRYDPRTLRVAVGAGENAGRTLPQRNVVRELVKLGRWNGSSEAFQIPAAKSQGLSTAVLVQIAGGGDIVSASSAETSRG